MSSFSNKHSMVQIYKLDYIGFEYPWPTVQGLENLNLWLKLISFFKNIFPGESKIYTERGGGGF